MTDYQINDILFAPDPFSSRPPGYDGENLTLDEAMQRARAEAGLPPTLED